VNSEKINILFVLHNISNAGIERVCLNLLKSINRDKFHIVVYLFEYNPVKLFSDDVIPEIKFYKESFGAKQKLRHFKRIIKLLSIIRIENPKIVIGFYSYVDLLISLSKLFFKFVHIATVHHPLKKNVYYQNVYMSLMHRIITFIALSKSDKIVTVSNATKKDVIEYAKINPKKIEVIYNGINLNDINNCLKEKVQLVIDKPYIVFVGRLEKIKSIDTLIKAFTLLKTRFVDLCLIILGDGSLKNELLEQAILCGYEQDIKFLGFTSNPYKYIENASCLVLPSIYEAFGYVIIEAMHCKTPVIASKSDGPLEIIDDKIDGLLFEPRDIQQLAFLIKEILENSNISRGIIINGVIKSKKFLDMHKKYENLFIDCI